MIEFLCPNGHKIRCQAAQAGRAAKCPRCGVKFRVPDADHRPADARATPTRACRSPISPIRASPANASATAAGSAKEPDFEFLCPNGHRLHGPANLQGRPGECPECGSRFRIPTYEDIPAEEEPSTTSACGRRMAARNRRSARGRRRPSAASRPRRLTRNAHRGRVCSTLERSSAGGDDRASAAKRRDDRARPVSRPCRRGRAATAYSRSAEADSTVSLVVVPWQAVDRISFAD